MTLSRKRCDLANAFIELADLDKFTTVSEKIMGSLGLKSIHTDTILQSYIYKTIYIVVGERESVWCDAPIFMRKKSISTFFS